MSIFGKLLEFLPVGQRAYLFDSYWIVHWVQGLDLKVVNIGLGSGSVGFIRVGQGD